MVVDPAAGPLIDEALRALPPGDCISLDAGDLQVIVAPGAGGRIAQIRFRGQPQLQGYSDTRSAMIAWGSYPMVPWAGRIRAGRFRHQGHDVQLPLNLQGNAIHGVGFGLRWRIDALTRTRMALSLPLPRDQRWPFGGIARQTIEIVDHDLRLQLSVSAQDQSLPAVVGWHPWFRKPRRLQFSPTAMYPRDRQDIACLPAGEVTDGPWDDCFINRAPVLLHYPQHVLHLSSDCDHWVIYDQPDDATCVEPQSGPPDAFNLCAEVLEPGQSLQRTFLLQWRD
ncbi:aldose epimerase [Pseudoxanthomonas dokdonensis]|uniref:Aldose epimerase n=1 Tax=Pseudoxanthomonas dokdonensis TaxID=344882 RepID=A0A0R0CG57_9GAMM|nr:aldose epimerase [Pseudoxanthomonas dokdonensis]KRG68501.1 aldose epimerase [Pseudoxanthomonas dokdonensis]